MLEIQVSKDQTKLLRQIKALKGLIKNDNDKDKLIHQHALEQLEKAI